jgi:hypothetical protein
MPNAQGPNGGIGIIILVLIVVWMWGRNEDASNTPLGSTDTESSMVLSRNEAIERHWDEIRDHLNATEDIEGCSLATGNCYDLDADLV